MAALDDYRASLVAARQEFLSEHPAVIDAFRVLSTGFDSLREALRQGRDADDKTHISLAPLLLILQRQAFVALDALSSQQAYQAWVLLRPGLECPLMMGKWMDDVRNYHIWNDRANNPSQYRQAYSGRALVSRSLPRAAEIQGALKALNDSFLHPNPDYYSRHTRFTDLADGGLELKLHFFDDSSFHWASVLSILHLLILVQESIGGMFAQRFVNLEVRPTHFGLAGFQEQHRAAAGKAASVGFTEAYVIYDCGLWDRGSAA